MRRAEHGKPGRQRFQNTHTVATQTYFNSKATMEHPENGIGAAPGPMTHVRRRHRIDTQPAITTSMLTEAGSGTAFTVSESMAK